MTHNLKRKIMLFLSATAAALVMTSVLAGAAEVKFPVAAYTPEELAKEIDKTFELTDKPFAVNLITISPNYKEGKQC